MTTLLLAAISIPLNGVWDFKLTDSNDVVKADWTTIEVPSCWEAKRFADALYTSDQKISGDRGFYRRAFTVPAEWPVDGFVRLVFEGVMFGAEVKVNGHTAGSFTSSFNEHELDVTGLVKRGADNLLEVTTHAVPKGWQFDTCDNWSFHGIFRDVKLVSRPRLHVKDWRISSRVAGAKAEVSLSGELSGTGSIEWRLISPEGVEVGGARGESAKITIDDAKLWTAETPFLHVLEIIAKDDAGRATETLREKVGLKEVTWQGRILKLNGRPIRLRGVNHHDITPDNACAVTTAEQWRDAEIIKAGNCNFVRTSHYPPSRAFMDACDELGIYVLDEVPFANGKKLLDEDHEPLLVERAKLTLKRDINRASVIGWNLGNEHPITPSAVKAAMVVKEGDATRPWMFPMQPNYFAKYFAENGLKDVGDILNVHYPLLCGIPGRKGRVTPEETGTYYFKNIDRPVIFGEYSHSNGDTLGALEIYEDMIERNEAIAGGAIWMFQNQDVVRWDDKGGKYYDSFADYGTDGVVYGDRTPQPDFFQMRKVYSPIKVRKLEGAADRFVFEIANRYDFVDLRDRVKAEWRLVANGQQVRRGEIELPRIPARSEGRITVETSLELGEYAVVVLELAFHDAKSGAEIVTLDYPVKVDAEAFAAAKPGRVDFGDSDFLIRSDRRFQLAKDQPCKTENPWYPDLILPTYSGEEFTCIPTNTIEKDERKITGRIRRTPLADGGLKIEYDFSHSTTQYIYETGLAVRFPKELTEVTWLGLGPYEALPAMSKLDEFGVWHLNGSDRHFEGNRRGTSAVKVTDREGRGYVVTSDAPTDFGFGRLPDGSIAISQNAFVERAACRFTKPIGMQPLLPCDRIRGSFCIHRH